MSGTKLKYKNDVSHKRRSASMPSKKRRKIEFSKKLVAWAMTLMTACVLSSYILAFNDHDPNSDVTSGVVSACIAIAVSYEAKSLGEKHSRNKFGIDRNGNKIKNQDDDSTALG